MNWKARLLLLCDTLYNWREIWMWPLIAFINLQLLVVVAYFLTRRWPSESADALVGLGFNLLLVALAVGATSAVRESTGYWFKKEEAAGNPHILWSQMIGKVFVFVAVLWALKH